ncbi:MAG TPA: C45 family autoproteolytic acyltransferase/hydrolase [Bacillota bacterium]|nr:C45 family autoproteolytic acyltransferase/hydrolase [Bacillota bacterium]
MRTFQLVEVNAATPFERGLQYGRQAKEKIRAGIEDYKLLFAQTSDKNWNQIKEYAVSYIQLIERTMPEILEEAKGIASGAEVDMAEIMVLNCRYEITKFPKDDECTTCAVLPEASHENKTYLVKNWDLRAGIIDNIVIVHIEEPDGTRIIGLTEAGQLIREGFNSHGVGLCNNSLKSIYDSKGLGIPVTFLRRKVLTSRTIDEAKGLLLNAQRSVSNNMLLVSKEGRAVDIEAFPKGADLIHPTDGLITHANHFVVNQELNALDISPRDTRLKSLLLEKHGSITIEYIKECMCDHKNYPEAICRHPADVSLPLARRSITVAGIIVDFEQEIMHICAGPPCEGEYIGYKL